MNSSFSSAMLDLIPLTDLEPRTRYQLLNFTRSRYKIAEHPTAFEKLFDPYACYRIMRQYFWTAWIMSAVYVVSVFALQALMRNRPPFKLKTPLVLWNAALFLFSTHGSFRLLTFATKDIWDTGFHRVVCMSRTDDPYIALWEVLFTASKIIEFGDTLFLILRKRPVIFLHWFHHAATLLFSWYYLYDDASFKRLFATMNLFVHTLMYGYYTLRALQWKVPRALSMALTLIQIVQMVVGLFITLSALVYRQLPGYGCDCTPFHTGVALFIYCTYLFLFAKFYHGTYLKRPSGKQDAEKKLD